MFIGSCWWIFSAFSTIHLFQKEFVLLSLLNEFFQLFYVILYVLVNRVPVCSPAYITEIYKFWYFFNCFLEGACSCLHVWQYLFMLLSMSKYYKILCYRLKYNLKEAVCFFWVSKFACSPHFSKLQVKERWDKMSASKEKYVEAWHGIGFSSILPWICQTSCKTDGRHCAMGELLIFGADFQSKIVQSPHQQAKYHSNR